MLSELRDVIGTGRRLLGHNGRVISLLRPEIAQIIIAHIIKLGVLVHLDLHVLRKTYLVLRRS